MPPWDYGTTVCASQNKDLNRLFDYPLYVAVAIKHVVHVVQKFSQMDHVQLESWNGSEKAPNDPSHSEQTFVQVFLSK